MKAKFESTYFSIKCFVPGGFNLGLIGSTCTALPSANAAISRSCASLLFSIWMSGCTAPRCTIFTHEQGQPPKCTYHVTGGTQIKRNKKVMTFTANLKQVANALVKFTFDNAGYMG